MRQVAREEYYEAKQREERITNIVIRNANEIEDEPDSDERKVNDDEDEDSVWTYRENSGEHCAYCTWA